MPVILQEHAVDRTRENKLRNQLLEIQQENCLSLLKNLLHHGMQPEYPIK